MRTRMTGQLVAVAGLLAALTGAHWNGTRWRSIPVPVTVSGIDTIRQDGHGGIWLLADAKGGDLAQYWYPLQRWRVDPPARAHSPRIQHHPLRNGLDTRHHLDLGRRRSRQ
jgi:hypothetical protein